MQLKSSMERFTNTQEEINYLSGEIAREHVLQATGAENRETAALYKVQEYAQGRASDFLHDTRVLPEHETEKIVLKLKPEAHDKTMEELFALMLDKGIKNALDVAKNLKNPHVEDDFHRFLVQYLHTLGAIPGLDQKTELYKELNHTLFTVSLPGNTSEENSFKSFISAMKQFYIGMQSAGDYFTKKEYYTLELAVEHEGNGIALYASIPTNHIDTFEKLVHAYYPSASIEEATNDYNIFSPESAAAISGSVARLSESDILPLSTDASFEHDPLVALISSLSKLESMGEGAAIQFTIANQSQHTNAFFASLIEQAEKQHLPVTKVHKEMTESVLAGVGKGLLSFFTTAEEKKEETPKETPSPEALGIDKVKIKNQSQILGASIRIVTSASTRSRAESLLSTIKASFNQFSLPGGNSIKWGDVSAGTLRDFCRDFSFRTLNPKELLALNVDELATLFHFPVGLSAAPELKESSAQTAPAPHALVHDGVYLGTNLHRGQTTEVYLAKEDRVRHCYVIGQTGTGKTTILKNMIIQDIKNGNGCCFIDPHGSDLEDILANIPPERLDDVIYFDPAYTARPMGLNMLEFDPNFPEQKTFVVNELLAIFNKLFDMKVAGGPMFEQYFRNSALLVMEDPESGMTLLEIGRVLGDKAFRDLKLSKCKNPIIKQFWENAEKTSGEQSLANFVPYITNKFDVFISNDIMRPVIAQQKSVLNFRDIMDNKKILLVNLSKGRLGDINSNLIGLVLVGKLTMAALSRVDKLGRETLPDFYLYIDEFQNVTTDSIATILSEARKYRLALTVAHQYIEQLEESIKNAVFGNVGNMIVYRVSPENASVFETQFAKTFSAEDIMKLENFNAYAKILSSGTPAKPFNLRIPPPPKGNLELSDKVKELSYMKYSRPRDEVDTEILARYK